MSNFSTAVLAPVLAATCKGVLSKQSRDLGALGHNFIMLLNRTEGGLNLAQTWMIDIPFFCTSAAILWNICSPRVLEKKVLLTFFQLFAFMSSNSSVKEEDGLLGAGFDPMARSTIQSIIKADRSQNIVCYLLEQVLLN
mmetsp:Transcript_25416/g.53681  ORF Transcript_25416/g.53681 Transcript_25416/m.53681 type:complete len:139 (+) Transcript_25416:1342-1758(+)